jgi:hypothetical protein
MDIQPTSAVDWKSIDAGKYLLTAYLHPQFSGFAVLEKDTRQLFHIDGQYLPEKSTQPDQPARKWLQEYASLLNIPFAEVHIGVYSPHFTLLPDIGIRSDLALEQLCRFDRNTDSLYSDKIDQEVSFHYAIPKSLTQLLTDHFARKTISFGEAGWLKAVTAHQPTTVCVHLVGSDLLVAAVEENHLKYLNRFHTNNAEEILYYILLVYNLLGYDNNSVTLEMHGFVEKVSPIYQQLYGYIANIRLGSGQEENTDLYQPGQSTHYYTNLLHL